VPSAYRPTKVDINQLTSQKQPESRFQQAPVEERSDVVRGAYQPIGKVDIAAIRRQARESGQSTSDRPDPVKGAYEPVGKVDIAAIRAKAQPAQERAVPEPQPAEPEQSKTLAERSAAFQPSERLTSLPKPKVANRFGGASNFSGTKAPLPNQFGIKSPSAAPVTSTSRTFADQGGKTPAQLWAERKARESGSAVPAPAAPAQPVNKQVSGGGGEWKSSYAGKSWAPVQTTYTGRSAGSDTVRGFDGEAPPSEPQAEVPPPLDHSNKPNAGHGIPLPGLPTAPEPAAEEEEEDFHQNLPTPPPQPPRSPTPPTPAREPSPIQVAIPVSRNAPEILVQDAHEEIQAPPQPLPIRSLEQAVPAEEELEEPAHDPARAVAQTSAEVAATAQSIRAIVQYDYEKAEDNEVDLKEGELVTDIEMIDADWWLGVNVHGERGLFPSNYVEVVEQESEIAQQEEASQAYEEPAEPEVAHEAVHEPEVSHAEGSGHTATALYDYEAAEDNELSFPDGAKIENIVSQAGHAISYPILTSSSQEFPDEDWWSGEYKGKAGLFPANYVELDQ
jgi:drebrin-like protein